MTKEVQYKKELAMMYHKSPLSQDIKITTDMMNSQYSFAPVSIEMLFDIYTKQMGHEYDFRTMLEFSNWLYYKVNMDHGFGITFPTKEMIVLVFIVETIYNLRYTWHRNSKTGELEGEWIETVDNEYSNLLKYNGGFEVVYKSNK